MSCVLLVIMIALHGKSYYPAPIYPALFAAGGVAIERLLTHRRFAKVAVGSVCLVGGAGLGAADITGSAGTPDAPLS